MSQHAMPGAMLTPQPSGTWNRRRFLLALAASLGLPSIALAQARDAVARIPSVRVGGVDYLDVRALGTALGWRTRSANAAAVTLVSSAGTVVVEARSRDFTVRGVRLFAGDEPRSYRNTVLMSRIDATALLRPLLNPAFGAPRQPVRTVCIDPGHGGKDPGTMNTRLGLKEKTFVLDLGLRLQRILQAAGYRVVMTRTTDVFLPLEDRARLSNRAKADCFLSLHFNATQSVAVNGAEMYVLTPRFQRSTSSATASASDRTALPGNVHDAQNTALGFALQRRIVQGLQRPDRGMRRARFAVLRPVDAPAALIEGGYLSNTAEARLIQRPEWRTALAEQVARAVGEWAASRG